MKVGIIRCMQTEDYCPGTADFNIIKKRAGAFKEVKEGETIEIIGFTNCGGCPGKKALLRAKMLIEKGADTIALASCISKGTPIGYACPFAEQIQSMIEKKLQGKIKLLTYTH